MTAEIAVMNKEAIALAADSAITIGGPGGEEKILTSGNKIFTASKYEPVAVMIYGNATLMGVPWEPIIKLYREQLGQKPFKTIEEYSNDLIKFLSEHKQLFPEDYSDRYFAAHIASYFQGVIRHRLFKSLGIKPEVPAPTKTADEWAKAFDPILKTEKEVWRSTAFLPGASAADAKSSRRKYQKLFAKIIEVSFEKIPLLPRIKRALADIASYASVKCPDPLRWRSATGVVVAGFGRDEIFPALRAFSVHGVFNGRLNHRINDKIGIGFDHEAVVVPFAQDDMVYAFMEGVDRSYLTETNRATERLVRDYPSVVIDRASFLDDAQKSKLKVLFSSVAPSVFSDYLKRLEKFRFENFAQEIVQLVSFLPKHELATLAESMVNLTTLRRKVSLGAETVGGPIDVALISKAEGLIWVKRKHYFDPALNHQFFANYYRQGSHEEKNSNSTVGNSS